MILETSKEVWSISGSDDEKGNKWKKSSKKMHPKTKSNSSSEDDVPIDDAETEQALQKQLDEGVTAISQLRKTKYGFIYEHPDNIVMPDEWDGKKRFRDSMEGWFIQITLQRSFNLIFILLLLGWRILIDANMGLSKWIATWSEKNNNPEPFAWITFNGRFSFRLVRSHHVVDGPAGTTYSFVK